MQDGLLEQRVHMSKYHTFTSNMTRSSVKDSHNTRKLNTHAALKMKNSRAFY